MKRLLSILLCLLSIGLSVKAPIYNPPHGPNVAYICTQRDKDCDIQDSRTGEIKKDSSYVCRTFQERIPYSHQYKPVNKCVPK